MRTTSTLVGLTLFALTATARAEEAAPAAATAEPPTAGVASPAHASDPKEASPAAVATAPATGPAAPDIKLPPPHRKLQVGLSFLPMALGRYTQSPNTVETVTSDASFAYGFGLSVGYEAMPGLLVGIAPQMIFNVEEKTPEVAGSSPQKQIDLMARVAYALPITDNTTVYAEVLPGYSVIRSAAAPKGLVLAFGAGAAIDMTDRIFVNLGVGYQMGFQSWSEGANTFQTRTKYVRVALGGGVKF
jgi:hypothetical protein